LAQALLEQGESICGNTAAAWLEQAGFRRRALRIVLNTGANDPQQRDAQFRRIAALPLGKLALRSAGLAAVSGPIRLLEYSQGLMRLPCTLMRDRSIIECLGGSGRFAGIKTLPACSPVL
jgi:hypothetical protein